MIVHDLDAINMMMMMMMMMMIPSSDSFMLIIQSKSKFTESSETKRALLQLNNWAYY